MRCVLFRKFVLIFACSTMPSARAMLSSLWGRIFGLALCFGIGTSYSAETICISLMPVSKSTWASWIGGKPFFWR